MVKDEDTVDERFMREAMREADAAAAVGEVPVGAVAVYRGEIVARGRNARERAQDPTAHAELIALRAAAHRLRSFRLSEVTLYVTLEPCPMCAGALVNARVGRVVYGCHDPKAGACVSLYRIGQDERLNHRFELRHGVLADECAAQLSNFFRELRKNPRPPFAASR
ncbi:MAG: nucleoside deaminase [Sandaracinaceae bacterium]|nr:nucleoside deaminase [Sandaracinaceae bacterium]